MRSLRELCPDSTFASNKSALKMYKEKKKKNNLKTGQIALVETHFSHAQLFPCISSSASQRELPACKTAVQMKLNPSPSPGLLRGTECCGPGVQLVGCCSRKSPLGFHFCADPCNIRKSFSLLRPDPICCLRNKWTFFQRISIL